MAALANWLAPRLRAQHPGLPPLRCGFHAVPNMKHLHLHLISLDFDSPELKKPHHWIIFNSDYLVPPHRWADRHDPPVIRRLSAAVAHLNSF